MDELSELERLEQKITLALYEIDANFNRCHRIVTTKILPIIEGYAEHSRRIWENSKFWKQFFETSANVSLSGYEELSQEISGLEETSIDAGDIGGITEGIIGGTSEANVIGDTPWTSTPLDISTPHATLPMTTSDAITSSPVGGSLTPLMSPATRIKKENPLLHRVLDSTWRLQVTPHIPFVQSSISSSSPAFTSWFTKANLETREEEDDLDASLPIGLSPPVTMQFSLPPSKLLKTPAREAARYVVDDILQTVGAEKSSTRPDIFARVDEESPLALVDQSGVNRVHTLIDE
ncbi:hypothetical protein PNEG_01127 [Pneumocystis murina B123]|uniref:DASH complex subunit ASK1 n=1 Tax=Pneumocystis murina (strain B123) TaxID=1069680 RepID=M7NT04_PNEMU|nr:hypothetical protein PNEG_01127 [Pneumocystis murina B123]EMR10412.1 hypothetical protein PNEG_01127 [Pneumocystis murina B123]